MNGRELRYQNGFDCQGLWVEVEVEKQLGLGAKSAIEEYGVDKFEIVTPSISILAEPPVAWVDRVVKKRNTEAIARAYLEFLYSPEGQEIAGRNFYRPRLPEVAARFARQFPAVKLVTIDEAFGGWSKAQPTHFAEGGTFDIISQPPARR